MMWISMQEGLSADDIAELLGFIPHFLNEDDPRPAREQIDTAYSHGGGWRPFNGHTLLPTGDLKYPGDPVTKLIAVTKMRDEVIMFYEHEWLLILQPNGEWEVARID